MLLSISVGLPFFLLASNSSLIQSWFNRAFPNRTPYRLYALSNLSSLVALVSYPFLIEPNLSLPGQGWIWSGGYLLFAGLAAFVTLRSMPYLHRLRNWPRWMWIRNRPPEIIFSGLH